MNTNKIIVFIGFILLPLLVGLMAGIATSGSVDTWYLTLEKPSFEPPGWLFAPVWTTLYLLMGISSFMVYNSPQSAMRTLALDVYFFQLFLNFLWSWLFFWLRNPGLALLEIVFLFVVLIVMIRRFYGINKLAGILQIPYLLWILFAATLNGAVWYLN